MLALIIFSFLIGFACLRSGKRAPFRSFKFRDEVIAPALDMKTAPIGLGAYFAYKLVFWVNYLV
jgi:Na+/H+-dicarboxylate symporter